MKAFKKYYLLVLIVCCCQTAVFAQEYSFKDYNWDEKEAYNIPDKYKDEKEVILYRNTKIEMVSYDKKGYQYYLLHEKKYINSDNAVERNNRIYIPFGADEKMVAAKARVILKNGKIIPVNTADIKEEIDKEKDVKYNYFAVSGMEKGAILERFWIIQQAPELSGETYTMQGIYPIVKNTLQLIYPSHLDFKYKSYNGLENAVFEEQKDTKTLTVTTLDTPALADDENYSNWDLALKMFRFKLDQNTASGSKNMYSFKSFGTDFYDRFHPVYEKSDLKAIDKFCADIAPSKDTQELIWNIENKIKKTIKYSPYGDAQKTLQNVFESRQANQRDLLRVYVAVFDKLQIENEMVITSSRYRVPFDKEFESYENLKEVLFYFPPIKQFMMPTDVTFRIPLFPSYYASNNGLFIKGKTFSGMKVGVSEVGRINIPDATITHDIMDITVDFTTDLSNPVITDKLTYGGYSAMSYQPVKDFIPTDKYQDFLTNLSKNYTAEAKYETLSAENDGLENVGKKPFVLNLSFKGKDLVRKAGDGYLFSAGQLIGKQMEIYQENKRKLPVEIPFPHSYQRKITILLPKGATVKNMEKFNMEFKADINGKTEAAFISTYTQKGGQLVIENTEYYNAVNYPLESFEAYRSVINAAADFSKLVIVINK